MFFLFFLEGIVMEKQNFENHVRFVPLFHYVLFGLLILTFIGSIVNLIKSFSTPNLYSASLIFVISIMLAMMFVFMRQFSLKAQDRAIRAEENLRHFAMTGKLLDSRLTIRQIIGLRFASDEEFLELAKKAAEENIAENDIKKLIKNWKGDYYRV